jgi:endonuclease YncB( thermonuclease family)
LRIGPTLLGFALLIAACGGSSTGEAETPPDLFPGVVSWIVDGDTVEVGVDSDVLTVRIAGINAPDRDECYYEEATDYLIDEIKGETVGLEILGTDQFDRTLAHLWIDDTLIGLTMVTDGLVLGPTPNPGDPHGDRILTAEDEAYSDGRGLWAHDACGASGPVPDVTIDTRDYDPTGPDGEHLDLETVTVINNSDQPLDLTGWVLRDESSRHRFHFEASTSIEVGGSVTVRSSDRNWDPGSGAVWNNDGDMALLLDDFGRVIDRTRYP